VERVPTGRVRTEELRTRVGRYGDRAPDFVRRYKGARAVSAAPAAFLADPEPFLDGSRGLAEEAASTAARPVTGWIGGALGRLVPDARRLSVVVLTFLTVCTLGSVLGR
jgi:hypothetical protein